LKILLVEDDAEMARVLMQGLREESYCVEVARDGAAALSLSKAASFDVVLLDVMLPDMDGLDVARQLRSRQDDIGVLMLTARDTRADVVKGLDAGADDYLTKPFSFAELLARIRALARRSKPKPKNVLEYRDLILETNTFLAYRTGRLLKLTLTEFRLLELLVRKQGWVVRRTAILEMLWGERREVTENTLDAFVSLLRRKIGDCGTNRLIETHRGLGYSVGAQRCD
jgi:DNA-binding response OmpR family regulator